MFERTWKLRIIYDHKHIYSMTEYFLLVLYLSMFLCLCALVCLYFSGCQEMTYKHDGKRNRTAEWHNAICVSHFYYWYFIRTRDICKDFVIFKTICSMYIICTCLYHIWSRQMHLDYQSSLFLFLRILYKAIISFTWSLNELKIWWFCADKVSKWSYHTSLMLILKMFKSKNFLAVYI